MNEHYGCQLVELGQGARATILAVSTNVKTAKRLADLGLTLHTKIMIVRKISKQGPVEILARGSSLVLGKGIATKILVIQDNG